MEKEKGKIDNQTEPKKVANTVATFLADNQIGVGKGSRYGGNLFFKPLKRHQKR
ncbi:hypothetical protein [Emticicia sp. C21]|uniref:hypothetical protein n=1 Tax=Emticicia sp. C21 TaxID=2302915 RepID=UPI0013149F45|nr:hypothetical protein [Emticicia sp. C21]